MRIAWWHSLRASCIWSCVACWLPGRFSRKTWLLIDIGVHWSGSYLLNEPSQKTRTQNPIKILYSHHQFLENIPQTSCKHAYFLKSIYLNQSCQLLRHKITKRKKKRSGTIWYPTRTKIPFFTTGKGKEGETISLCFSTFNAKQLAWKLKNSANYLDILVCLIKKNSI